MSEKNFDKKIREKLTEHSPKYEKGAWDSFKKMLPAPWYIRAYRDYGAWLFGGLATTALVLSTIYQSQKTNRLNEEIFTLTEKLNQTRPTDTVYVNTQSTDTVMIREVIKEYVPVEKLVFVDQLNDGSIVKTDKASKAKPNEIGDESLKNTFSTNEPGVSSKPKSQNPELDLSKEKVVSTPVEKDVEVLENTAKPAIEKSQVTGQPNSQNNLNQTEQPSELAFSKEAVVSVPVKRDVEAIEKDTKTKIEESKALAQSDGRPKHLSSIQVDEDQSKEIKIPEVKNEASVQNMEVPEGILDSVSYQPVFIVDELSPERTGPEEKPKKKINWPQMRAGISSDYQGFKSILTGPVAEVFLTDKLSLNTGVLFSAQTETKHQLAMDFNRKTGKRFEEEYGRYIPRENPQIRDISIKTSLIKMPVNFNYYINTWSRFNFMVSAGTRLDLSVYQDINFVSGLTGNQINRRFEARPKAKVFNNLFYGMGVQYQYRSFVAQLTPYFEFKFRNPDYFTPPRNVGINGSLKFQFGK